MKLNWKQIEAKAFEPMKWIGFDDQGVEFAVIYDRDGYHSAYTNNKFSVNTNTLEDAMRYCNRSIRGSGDDTFDLLLALCITLFIMVVVLMMMR